MDYPSPLFHLSMLYHTLFLSGLYAMYAMSPSSVRVCYIMAYPSPHSVKVCYITVLSEYAISWIILLPCSVRVCYVMDYPSPRSVRVCYIMDYPSPSSVRVRFIIFCLCTHLFHNNNLVAEFLSL